MIGPIDFAASAHALADVEPNGLDHASLPAEFSQIDDERLAMTPLGRCRRPGTRSQARDDAAENNPNVSYEHNRLFLSFAPIVSIYVVGGPGTRLSSLWRASLVLSSSLPPNPIKRQLKSRWEIV